MMDELVRAAAKGNEDAFAQLVRLHENASDVAPEAFLSAWRGLPNFRGESGFTTWLYRLVNNAAIDHLRRGKKQRFDVSMDDEEAPVDTPDPAPGPQEAAEGTEL